MCLPLPRSPFCQPIWFIILFILLLHLFWYIYGSVFYQINVVYNIRNWIAGIFVCTFWGWIYGMQLKGLPVSNDRKNKWCGKKFFLCLRFLCSLAMGNTIHKSKVSWPFWNVRTWDRNMKKKYECRNFCTHPITLLCR